jgi:hypothetical protein
VVLDSDPATSSYDRGDGSMTVVRPRCTPNRDKRTSERFTLIPPPRQPLRDLPSGENGCRHIWPKRTLDGVSEGYDRPNSNRANGFQGPCLERSGLLREPGRPYMLSGCAGYQCGHEDIDVGPSIEKTERLHTA